MTHDTMTTTHMTSRRQFLGGAAALLGLGASFAHAEAAPADAELHLLNRLTWGPRPGELKRLRDLGAEAFLDEQLHFERLDDGDADVRLAEFPILAMNRRTLYGLQNAQGRARRALVRGMLERAVYSERQLLERMVEFWSDHFNVPSDFDNTLNLVVFQQDVRRHALGRFRDLLAATAKSPAMLYYLDNYVNVKERPNENYARELLELHTLGVDGGYTEQDVKATARAFTGWTIHDRTETGFYFDDSEHDTDAKKVLGRDLPAGRGLEDGLHVLGILADHPATARFVCRKLCVRFVSDAPPESLVDRLADVWAATGGEIKPVLRALFLSEEFKASAGQKLRRPLDFFVGALRASGTRVREWWLTEELLEALGQTPYGWHPPDGYPDVAAAWLSANGLLTRWNTAMRLTHGALSDADQGYGLSTRLTERTPEVETVGELVAAVSRQVFGARLPEAALEPFVHYASDGAGAAEPVTPQLLGRKLGSLYGLMLASPQFQWR